MRKRNCKKFFDTLMWTTLYMLPIFMFFIINYAPNLGAQTADYGFVMYELNDIMLDFFNMGDNIFSIALYDLFGAGGILPLFNGYGVVHYLSYVISVNILHLFVDIILALPRFCHKFLDKFALDED